MVKYGYTQGNAVFVYPFFVYMEKGYAELLQERKQQ